MIFLKRVVVITPFIIWLSACHHPADKATEKEPAASQHDMHNMTMASAGYADSVNNGLIELDTMKSSPKRIAMASVGKTHLHITYHAPGVKGRVVWGGLVPYNSVWVTGAHSATRIQLNHPIEIGGRKMEAGTYALFTIPGEKEWTFIVNKNYEQHLADDYKETEDVLRIAVKPVENKMTPRLTYSVGKTGDSTGSISMQWEKLKIDIPFKIVK